MLNELMFTYSEQYVNQLLDFVEHKDILTNEKRAPVCVCN